jgi:oligoendopeptidase F
MTAVPTEKNAIPARADVPRETTWDTDSIFATPAEWQAEFDALQGGGEEIAARFAGHLADGTETVAAYFAASEALMRRLGKIAVYASLCYAVDTGDQTAAGRADRARGLFARTAAALAFAEPELLAIGPDMLLKWADADAAGLKIYRHYFDQLARRAPHVRSVEVEGLLKQAMEAFGSASSIHGKLTDADLTFSPAVGASGEPEEIGQGTIGKLLADPDRAVRRTAYENYADAHLAFKNTMAQCLSTGVKQDVFLARARGYESALHAALEPNHIPVAVFHSLIATFERHLPTWHRYWGLRRRALGLDRLAPYDVKAPLAGASPVVPYVQGVDWIAEGMAPLGEEYAATLRRGSTADRWVDVYPNKGKRMGAFSSGTPGTNPFILMSYNDDLAGLSTLAHELGHSLHSYLSWQTQPYVYSRYGLFAAEVASNFNQALVRAHLLEKFKGNRDFQIALIEEAMGNFHRYFFVMPTLARFELEMHDRVWRGEALTAQTLTDRMAGLFAEAFGPEVDVDRARVGSTWMQFSTHLYANFYVFQYATGISGAHALADRVLKEGKPAAEDYLAFLHAGGSLYPLDALKRAGVDLSVPDPVEKTFGVLAGYVDRLQTLLGGS